MTAAAEPVILHRLADVSTINDGTLLRGADGHFYQLHSDAYPVLDRWLAVMGTDVTAAVSELPFPATVLWEPQRCQVHEPATGRTCTEIAGHKGVHREVSVSGDEVGFSTWPPADRAPGPGWLRF